MNVFLKKIVSKFIRTNPNAIVDNSELSHYQFIKAYSKLRQTWKHNVKDFLLIIFGILSATFGFKGFLLTNHFIDGGATGISLLISALTKVPLYILILTINIPFVILGYKILGKEFVFKTIIAIAGLALSLAFLEVPNITNDNLLVAVFGGFFLGAGIGLSIRGGAVIDGTEILAIFLSKKFGTTIGDIITIINIIIFAVAAYFLSLEIALYSMITYVAASKTLDFIVEGIDEYIGVTIVSVQSNKIREMIIEVMGRGVTVYKGERGYGKSGETQNVDIIYTVITRLELNKLKREIENITPNAFMVMNSVKDTKGGIIKQRSLKH